MAVKFVFMITTIICTGMATDVSINGPISAPIRSNGTELVCTFVEVVGLISASFSSYNDSNDIAQFSEVRGNNLTPAGQYLKDRVVLEGITNIEGQKSQVKMIFTDLQCIDEGHYWCKIAWITADNTIDTLTSGLTTVSILTSPSKPSQLILYNTKSEEISSTSYESLNTTTTYSTTTMLWDSQTSIYNREKNENVLQAGDSLTISCIGNVGSPPEPLLVQKIRTNGRLLNITALPNSTETAENCSYIYISMFSTELIYEDNGAVFRCGVRSRIFERDMFIETDPIDVKYPVHKPQIEKEDDQATENSVRLFCMSDGNPSPNYQWYRQDNVGLEPYESTQNIAIYNVTERQTYICKVNNTIKGVVYKNETSIVLEAQGATQSFTWISSSAEKSSTIDNTLSTIPMGPSVNSNLHDSGNNKTAITVLGIVCGILSIIIICGAVLYLIQRKRLKSYESGNRLSTVDQYDSVSNDRTAHHYDDLQRRREHDYNNTTFSMHNT